VHDDGSINTWLNLSRPDNGANTTKVGWLPQGTIATGIGKDRAGVQFADLNSNGHAKYLYVDSNSTVKAYLNLGRPDNRPNTAKVGWLPQGTIITSVGMGWDSIMFTDINSDRHADYITMDQTNRST
jgi:hypothetical protein